MTSSPHYSVMLNEVVEAIAPKDGGVYVDGTFGAGGYTRALLEAADCVVYAIDRDSSAMQFAGAFEDEFGERFVFLQGCFGDVQSLLAKTGVQKIDGFVLDVGVSSMQLDQAGRGFSFRENGPLDMRMDSSAGETAADIVNSYEENALADLIYLYGEERKSRWVAKKIVEARREKPLETTFELADVVRSAVPKGKDKIDPATRTFQALRIAVNDELGELERALDASIDILSDEGRLVVVSFHSLEDRIVKQFMKEQSETQARGSRHLPDMQADKTPAFSLLSRKAIKPTDQEVAENARSRSAKMRVAIRQDNAEVPHA